MKKQILLLFSLIILLASACDNQKEDSRKLRSETKIYWASTDNFTPEKSKPLLQKYKDYINTHPKDTSLPDIIFDKARIEIAGTSDYQSAFADLERIYHDFPASKRAPEALQLEAFTYDETLKEPIRAKEKYEELIAKYPNHPFAKDAKLLIQYLGKDLNEIFSNKADVDSALPSKPVIQ